MDIRRQFGSGVAWMAAGNWIEQAVNFALFVILARLLGVEAYGIMAMAAAFVLLCEALVRDSLSDFLIAARAPSAAEFNATFWLLAALGGGLLAGLLLAAGPVAAFYGRPEVATLLRALAFSVPMVALAAVPVAILRRGLRFRVLALRAIAGVVAGGAVALALALGGFGVWSLVAQRLVQVGVNAAMAWVAAGWRPGLGLARGGFGRLLRFGGAALGLRGAELAALQLPSVVIGASLGPVALGLFSAAWKLIEIASFLIVTPLRLAAQPAFARMRRDGARAAVLLQDVLRLSGMQALAAFAGLALLAGPVIELTFGPSWLGAVPILQVLAVLGAYFCIEKLHQAFCLAAGRVGATALLSWLEVALALALALALRPGGVVAMAGGVVAAFLVLWGGRFRVVAAVAGISPLALARLHLAPLPGVLAMAAAVVLVQRGLADGSAALRLAAGIVTGGAVFLLHAALAMPGRLRLLRRFLPGFPSAPGGGGPRERAAGDTRQEDR